MGCVSSKLIRKEIERDNLHENRDFSNHVVSLTSSTYGALKLDKETHQLFEENQQQELQESIEKFVVEAKKSPPREEPSEIINTWELMEGLEEEGPGSVRSKRSPKSRIFLDGRSPLKFLNQMGSPMKFKKLGGKENKERVIGSTENSPKTLLKECNSLKENSRKPSPRLWVSSRRSLGPLFNPEPVASLEKEGSKEEEMVKKIVSSTYITRKWKRFQDSESILESFSEKCPPGGENAVIIYTTTLRGIRKTFEDCNKARSIIESHDVQMLERDISMHAVFKEELRGLIGTKDVKVPLVFVKGRLISGVDEIAKLDEEGKLEILFDGIPRAAAGCRRCGGFRFVMCTRCYGSCKVLDEGRKKTVKCSECNENGLIQCPVCC
ncbi:Glutaredoxin family [Olea europaea subsp. europaea]|uniref:Glutaredoxin family n=1 Tax=Olea europaea subsp. europaea TaxID=158383 RepID=A0A8S0R0H6_OLEEU|nr:Glutaredoxin family [Olea europaea subsp. europaea]